MGRRACWERAVGGRGEGLKNAAGCLMGIQKTRLLFWAIKQAGDAFRLPLLSHMPDGGGSRSGNAAARSIRRRPSLQPCRIPGTQGRYPVLRVLTSSPTSSVVGL